VVEFEPVALAKVTDRSAVDRAEFDRRFGLARSRLEAICASLVGAGDAQDIVHDVYLHALRRLGQLRDAEHLEAWLSRIAVNACYASHRARRRSHLAAYPLGVLEAQCGRDIALRELVERLPPRERTVLVLHYGHGYALDEIAGLLGINYATVRSLISRTRQRLYREWSAEE
jgi:DNA-directed RNA polymerase specialized sigma24 family protein